MRILQPQVLFSTWLMLLVSASAVGDEALPITILNDNPDAILVSVYDMNLQPPAAILMGQHVNGFASIKISITPGAAGYGHLSWTASSADTFSRRCSRRDRSGIQSNAVVHVYAKAQCR